MKENGGRLGTACALGIIIELCDILTYLHSQTPPIIHRDVKPSNIIVCNPRSPEGAGVKLIDFGISRRFSAESDTDTTYFGTKKFSPPEQYGFAQTDCRTDIYALGVVLRYMLTGALDGQIEDRNLSKIIEKCTAFSPNDRYKSVDALIKNLIKHQRSTKRSVLLTLATALCICAILVVSCYIVKHTELLTQTNLPFVSGQISTEVAIDEPATFIEPLIEKAVRVMLNRVDDEPIYLNELKEISELYINGNKIAGTHDEFQQMLSDSKNYGTIDNLDDMRMITNIRALYLNAQPLTDVSPLTDCLLLEDLWLERCPITDVSALTALPRLSNLSIYECNIEDVSYFADFRALILLTLGGMPLIDLSELNAPQIHYLDIYNSAVVSLEEVGLERFPMLKSLAFAGTLIDDLSVLDEHLNIERIFISPHMARYLHTMSRDDIEIEVID